MQDDSTTRTVHKDGYAYLMIDGKPVAEHRIVMAQKLGRALTPNDTVHHINQIKSDNSPDNLTLIDRAEHGRLHQRLSKLTKMIERSKPPESP